MVDDGQIKLSFGAVAGWIEKAAEAAPQLINHDVALNHLAMVEAAFDEYRLNIQTLRNLVREIKRTTDAASNL